MDRLTVEKYLHYLEAAFLIKILYRVDSNAKSFKRQTTYKVFLTNPCIRQALFGPVTEQTEGFGHLVETAIFGQLLQSHQSLHLYYARWKNGKKDSEIDFVILNQQQHVRELLEVKWSDNIKEEVYNVLKEYAQKNKAESIFLLTKSTYGLDDNVEIWPVAMYCLYLGLINLTHQTRREVSYLKEQNEFLRKLLLK